MLGRKEPNMIIIGVDFHPEFQQIAWDTVYNPAGVRDFSVLAEGQG
jgi:hypothetical protein